MSQGSQKMLVSLFGLHLIQTILRIGTPRFWHFRVNPEVPSAQCWNRKLKKTYHVQAFSSKALNESRFFILSQNVIFSYFFVWFVPHWKDIFCWHFKILAHLTESWSSVFTLLEYNIETHLVTFQQNLDEFGFILWCFWAPQKRSRKCMAQSICLLISI